MLSVGVLGCGYWGPNVIRNFAAHPQCRLKYACDLKAENRDAIQRRYPGIQVTGDYRMPLHDRDLDAVAIVTPLQTHYVLAREALLAGKHVLIEKPFVSSVAEADDLLELADRQHRVLMVGQTYLYSPEILEIQRLIQQQEIGDLHVVHSTRAHFGHVRANESVIWDLASHDLSILFYWINPRRIAVSCSGKDCLQRGHLDTANIMIDFLEDGPIAFVFVSWLAPFKMRTMSITGSQKMIFYNDMRSSEKIKIYDQSAIPHEQGCQGDHQWTYRTGHVFSPPTTGSEPLAAEVNDFITSIHSARQPRSHGEFNLAIVKTLEAIYSSLQDGQKVTVTF